MALRSTDIVEGIIDNVCTSNSMFDLVTLSPFGCVQVNW